MIKDLHISISLSDLQLDTHSLYVKYETQIIEAFNWVQTTQKSYRSTIDSSSEFLAGISFCDCTTDDFDYAIKRINEQKVQNRKKPYSENTLKGFRSVFTDLCYFCENYSNGLYHSVVWGSDWRSPNDSGKQIKKQKKQEEKEDKKKRARRQVSLPRSLTLTQEIKLVDEIIRGITKNSYYAGLALGFYLGLRPGECCGVTYGDIRPLEGYPEAHCLYVYEQLTANEESSNDLKSANAYRVLPVSTELYQLILTRKSAVEYTLGGNCDHCYIVCQNETRKGLQRQCNRRNYRVFAQTILRSIKVDEHVVINLSKEIKGEKVSESNVTTYLLRRNFATALSGVCGMEDDELKYLMGHAIGTADEKRHDFVNPDTLFLLWEKLNLRAYMSPYKQKYMIKSKEEPILIRQKQVKLEICSSALKEDGVHLRIFNAFPNDYVRVCSKYGQNDGVSYRTALEPSELKRIGRIRIHNEFAEAVQKARNKLK